MTPRGPQTERKSYSVQGEVEGMNSGLWTLMEAMRGGSPRSTPIHFQEELPGSLGIDGAGKRESEESIY
jgi:hypothetical protein